MIKHNIFNNINRTTSRTLKHLTEQVIVCEREGCYGIIKNTKETNLDNNPSYSKPSFKLFMFITLFRIGCFCIAILHVHRVHVLRLKLFGTFWTGDK